MLFIGPIAEKYPIIGGCVAKNKILKEYLESSDIKLITIDTYWEKKNIIYTFYHKSVYNLILVIRLVICSLYADDIIMGAQLYRIMNLLEKVGGLSKLILFGIGGMVPELLKENLGEDKVKKIKVIYVESKDMVKRFDKYGVVNAEYLPNFKKIPKKKYENNKIDGNIRKVFYIGKISEEKGIDVLIRALNYINTSEEGKVKFELFLYGPIDCEECNKLLINETSWIYYKGKIDLIQGNSNYDELVNYDIFVFPTRWKGEGFPGVLIDAMYLGKAIIASDFGYNTEIIQDGYNGFIYNNTESDLISKLNFLYENPKLCTEVGNHARQELDKYDVENVLSILDYKKLI